MKVVRIAVAASCAASVVFFGMSNATFVVVMLVLFFAVVGRYVWAMRFS